MADDKKNDGAPDTTTRFTIVKVDDPNTSIRMNSVEYEDEFRGLYGAGKFVGQVEVLAPPYNPKQLEALTHNNNTLRPCIDAMLTNVHGTGYSIDPDEAPEFKEDESEESRKKKEGELEKQISNIEAFFHEPFPGISWNRLRTNLGDNIESIGYGALEMIRSRTGEMVFLKHVDAKMLRMVKLGDPIVVPTSITRNGVTVEAPVQRRFRRFAQLLGTKRIFFKEYGCPVHLHVDTGEWETKTYAVPPEKRATEIIFFTKVPDPDTPYGVPVWVPQIPSVLGSRRAEEQNLSYFDNGGIPPMMMLVQGGKMAAEARRDIQAFMAAKPENKHSVPIIEVYNSGGTDGSGSNVKITVERFGSERQSDSMFEKYDERCEIRIRRAWRLPPIFTGGIESYNFATAFASYTVAEAQIFAPERLEFDDIINRTVMKELKAEGFTYRSKPLTVRDIANQLKALEMAYGTGELSTEDLFEALANLTDLQLKVTKVEPADMPPQVGPNGEALGPDGKPVEPGKQVAQNPKQTPEPTDTQQAKAPTPGQTQKSDPTELAQVVFKGFSTGMNSVQMVEDLVKVFSLKGQDRDEFNSTLAEIATEAALDIGDEAGDDVLALVIASLTVKDR
jgi:PBSX family phage portal protein